MGESFRRSGCCRISETNWAPDHCSKSCVRGDARSPLSRIAGAGVSPDLFCALLCALPASGQEFVAAAGATRNSAPQDDSYGWAFSFSRDLAPNLALSFSYHNEGHFEGHHRDGHAAQIWAQAAAFRPELTFAAGIGPYRYFDTSVARNRRGFADAHGWGTMASLTATWREPGSRWLYQLRFDRVDARTELDTMQLLVAIGYRFDQDGSLESNAITRVIPGRANEVALLGGRTIVNSFDSQTAWAKSAEYGRAFGPVLRGSIGWLNEGNAQFVRRDGVIAEAWLEPSFYRDRFTLGIGAGGYFAVHQHQHRDDTSHNLVVVSTTFSYHFAKGWVGRFVWHRIASNYDRDSDILLLGLGYRF